MAEPADDWAPVVPPKPTEDWVPVSGPMAWQRPDVTLTFDPEATAALRAKRQFDDRFSGEPAVPQAFIERVMRGNALTRIAGKAATSFSEGAGESTPTGLSDKTLNELIEVGIFHDPATGKFPNAIQYTNEMLGLPLAKGWETLMRGLSGGVHAIGGLVGAVREELGGSETEGNQAKREITNLGNMLLIEAGMGRYSRPKLSSDAHPLPQEIGTLPKEADFKLAAEVSGAKEAKLKEAWQERGIHPAEAVADAERDAFLKHDLSTPRSEPNTLAEFSIETFAKDNGIRIEVLHPNHSVFKTRLSGDVGGPGTFKVRGPHYDPADRSVNIPDVSDAQFVAAYGADKATVISHEVAHGLLDKWDMTGSIRGAEYKDLRAELTEVSRRFRPEVWDNAPKYAGKSNELMTDGVAIWMTNPAARAEMPLFKKIMGSRLDKFDEPFASPHSLGAAATDNLPPADVPFSVQPAPPPGRIAAAVTQTADALFDIGKDIQMKVAPMATGTTESMAAAKDFANAVRRNRWEWSRQDNHIVKNFTREQDTRMFNAMDEESVAIQKGEAREHQGLATLEPRERALVEDMDNRQQIAFLRAKDLGMVEGDGIPMHATRMVMNIANATDKDAALSLDSIGSNLKVSSPNLRHRKYLTVEETEAAAKAKYGEQAVVARSMRAVALSTAKLEDAIAGRSLINNIKEIGKATGEEAVAEGAIPAGSAHKWFTLDHPAFKTWRPKFEEKGGKVEAVKDAEGNVVFEQVPLYVRGDFEGPLRAVLNTKSGPLYNAAMELKGKTMSLIMYSPAIHNMVEFGRAFPAMPTRIFKAYFDGNRAKNDIPLMREAIDNGLVPIGKRFFKQDLDGIMEAPDLTPGRSWTSQVLAAVPGLFDEAAGTAVKRAVDKAGDFWHNTLLWDRIADLQMGIYVNMRGDLVRKGVDPQTSSRIAAHLANRYAGALPIESMSAAARKSANLILFSRTFTLGNLGVMKDMLTGMPKDVLAQIERDMGTINPEAKGYAASMARRKAVATIALDVGLMYVGNSVLQSAFSVMLGDRTMDEEMHGYVKRTRDVMNEAAVHPMSLLQPFDIAEKLSTTSENEPGRKERVKIGYQKDGTAIYARNPVGKIGEEFLGFATGPIDMLRRKEGTIARPAMQVFSNDKGFGRKVYDPNADTWPKYAGNIWAIVEHFAKAQTPEGQITAFSDLVKGDGDPKTNLLQSLGPFAGVTFSKGAPGGPAVGEMYKSREIHDYQVQLQMPDIRKQIQRGDVAGAQQRMTDLGIPAGLQRFYIRTSQNPATRLSPRALRDFYQYATPEQRARMERARATPTGPLTPD